jgi:alkylation response protein AidB-like acyl-CoA dehydrogenase
MNYRAPVRDLQFSLREAAGFGRLQGAFPAADDDTVAAILDAAGDFSAEVLAPLNRVGDTAGARLENGGVRAAPGFADAYKAFARGGWCGLAADPAFGGQGLPKALEIAVFEIFQAANLAFGLCPLLTLGAAELLGAHGTDRQKALVLPKLVSGQWTGAMNLTESQAGSDLGGIATHAIPDGQGGYRLTGEKVFITWGDHDMAENIVHLVLARLPDAPAGSRGLSLFLAPKFLISESGAIGAANALRPARVEHKLGIHGSPTCVMLYEGAQAELVGTANQGLAAMFVMMNAARLHVGVQGVAIAERAYQQALAYALERKQGRSAWTGAAPARLFDHPDVRRSLMVMKARIEAARGLCLSTAVAADLAGSAANPLDQETARLREDLLTPIAKAWSTDMGVEVASVALQIHGGMGFMEETGVAQHYRDARILPIYEGANGIQAIDLIGRKLAVGEGRAVRELMADIGPTVAALKGAADPSLQAIGARLDAGLAAARSATEWIVERRGGAQPDVLAGATPYLKLLGDVVGGWMLAKGALAAARRIANGEGPSDHWRTKIGLARVYAEQILAQAPALSQAVSQGAADLAQATPESLGA